MTRKQRRTAGQGWIELIALLPWWACIALAMVSYLVLHKIALQPIAVSVQPGQVGTGVASAVYRGFATVGQYILPIVCSPSTSLSRSPSSARR